MLIKPLSWIRGVRESPLPSLMVGNADILLLTLHRRLPGLIQINAQAPGGGWAGILLRFMDTFSDCVSDNNSSVK